VLVCQSGFRSGIAAGLLMARGHARLSVLSGGIDAWNIMKSRRALNNL
jgi:rhodanese-related sulfurtransferase